MKQPKRILRIDVARLPDEDADTSQLGEYSNKPSGDYSIDRAHYENCATQHTAESQPHITHATDYLRAQWDSLPRDSQTFTALDDALDLLDRASDGCEECDCNRSWDLKTFRYFNTSGNYTGEPMEDIVRYTKQDYARMESLNNGEWEFIGIRACADITFSDGVRQSIYSSGLWGIESDSKDSYLVEIEQEQMGELRATLHELGFSKRAIATAIKTAV